MGTIYVDADPVLLWDQINVYKNGFEKYKTLQKQKWLLWL